MELKNNDYQDRLALETVNPYDLLLNSLSTLNQTQSKEPMQHCQSI